MAGGYGQPAQSGNVDQSPGQAPWWQEREDKQNAEGRRRFVEDQLLNKFLNPDTASSGAMQGLAGAGSGYPSLDQGPSADILRKNNDAIFANAKDHAANIARSAMTGLQGELQSRGMGGGGYEGGKIGETLSREADQIGGAERQNDMSQYQQAIDRGRANLGAQVTMRGQDLQASQAAASLEAQKQAAARSGLASALSASISNRPIY